MSSRSSSLVALYLFAKKYLLGWHWNATWFSSLLFGGRGGGVEGVVMFVQPLTSEPLQQHKCARCGLVMIINVAKQARFLSFAGSTAVCPTRLSGISGGQNRNWDHRRIQGRRREERHIFLNPSNFVKILETKTQGPNPTLPPTQSSGRDPVLAEIFQITHGAPQLTTEYRKCTSKTGNGRAFPTSSSITVPAAS